MIYNSKGPCKKFRQLFKWNYKKLFYINFQIIRIELKTSKKIESRYLKSDNEKIFFDDHCLYNVK